MDSFAASMLRFVNIAKARGDWPNKVNWKLAVEALAHYGINV